MRVDQAFDAVQVRSASMSLRYGPRRGEQHQRPAARRVRLIMHIAA